MAKPKAITTLRRRGYSVDESHPGTEETPPVYFIEGHGVAIYLREDDAEGWASLTDKAAHRERRAQARGESDPLAAATAQAARGG